uniref:Uncharacterized protein n=1 Tax=Arundo donax TaxID=35708 RepID=A0A0A9DGB5_ARUDO
MSVSAMAAHKFWRKLRVLVEASPNNFTTPVLVSAFWYLMIRETIKLMMI